jgi:polar amino acid transport system substrate-binding protein
LFVAICAAATGLRLASGAERPPLRWAADAEGGAPYIFSDPANPRRQIGFEVDLIAALAKELGRRIEFHQYNYDSLISGLERGDFDFAMNGLEITADRAKRVRFSRPYYIYSLQLVARADDRRFRSLEDCKSLEARVGTLGDTAASRLLEQMGISAKIYDGQAEPYQDLLLGRIDAVLMDLPIAVYYAQPNPQLKLVGRPVGEGYYAIAFRPGEESLAAQFDTALVRLAEQGELQRIYQKWQIWNDDQLKLATGEQLQNILRDSGKQWTFATYFPLLLDAAKVTVKISIISMLLAMAIALPIAMIRLYGPAPLRLLAIGYVEFFRGIPVLLLLYLLYYGLPSILQQYHLGFTFKPSDFTVAVLAFGLNYAAYEAEIYRSGIAAIPIGQWEAAASLGMSRPTTFRRIIMPQALRTIVPPVTNDFVALFKDTSLVSVIAVVELTKQYQILAKSSLKYLQIGLATAALYLLMSVPLGYLSRYLEKRWGRAG